MDPNILDNKIWYLIVTAITIWSYKVVSLLIGYLFVKLGYKLLVKGVTGEFKFQGEIKGIKADLVSASPGLFFILMGTIIVGIGLFKGISIESVYPKDFNSEVSQSHRLESQIEKPSLRPPDSLNKEEKSHDSNDSKQKAFQ